MESSGCEGIRCGAKIYCLDIPCRAWSYRFRSNGEYIRSEVKLRTISVILNLLPRNYTAKDRKITKSELETLTNHIDIDDGYEIFLKSVPYFMELERSVDQQDSAHPWHTTDVKMTRKAPMAWSAVHGR